MSPVLKSLTYDAVVLAVAVVVAALTDGPVRPVAVLVGCVTVLKAPYDVWEARRRPSE
jgi:hypothetical protein